MIECPICHVKNDGESRFCAECGHRIGSTTGGPVTGPPATGPGQPPQQGEQRPQQRLHSPLLSNETPQTDSGAGQASADVNRLRQMSKGREERPQTQLPETPYKNPFDPRNSAGTAPQDSGAQPPADAPRKRLRSPLLAAEEFDDDEAWIDDPAPSAGKGNLRSPMLGGGTGGGGGKFKSPLLGGGSGAEDYQSYDQQSASSGGLRSPLLRGGGGGGFAGDDRRRAPLDENFQGQDRRRGLRSPILGGSIEGDNYYDDDDDEPIDEDNPNVLRSPLLSSRRPVVDRQKPPSGSNAQNPQRATQTSEVMQIPNKPSPNSSYTSLQSIKHTADVPMPAQATPPPPGPSSEMPPGSNQPGYASHPYSASAADLGYQSNLLGGAPSPNQPAQFGQNALGGTAGGYQSPPGSSYNQTPEVVPPAFQNMSNTMPGTIDPGSARPYNEALADTDSNIPVQGPSSPGLIPPAARAEGPQSGIEEGKRNKSKPKMLAGYGDEEVYTYQTPENDRFNAPASPPSPVPKIIGVVIVLLFLGKSWVLMQVLGSDWKNYAFLVVDQFIGIILLACLAALAFTQKN